MLLKLSGDTIEAINDGISHLVKLGKADGNNHDFSMSIGDEDTGLTIHSNDEPDNISVPRLNSHCERRKYKQKANQWFGVCVGTNRPRVRFGVNKDFQWVQSDEMDDLTKDMPDPQPQLKGNKKINFRTVVRKNKKIGRNEECSCGSGEKYKKCCL
jgi:hypothetical protein